MFKKAFASATFCNSSSFHAASQPQCSIATPLPIKEKTIFLVKGSEGKKKISHAPKDSEAREMTNGGERSVSHHQTMNE